jgi:hypothetical protein
VPDGDGRYSALSQTACIRERMAHLTTKSRRECRRCARAERRKRLVQPCAVPTPQRNAPLRKGVEREMDAPEGNLVIVEWCIHERQHLFSCREYGWVGTAHSTEQHCTRCATHADACAPFGFGFAESILRFASRIFRRFVGTHRE